MPILLPSDWSDLAHLAHHGYGADIAALERELVRDECERSLMAFHRQAWPMFDPAPFVGGWHLEAIAEHLEAVTRGEIRKLLINIPPRHCFPADQIIQTEIGPMPIGEVVGSRLALRVPSWSEQRQRFELQPITGWHENPGADIYRLTFSNGLSIRCTADHRLRVAGGNWLAAADIPIGSAVPIACVSQSFGSLAPVESLANVVDVDDADAIATGQDASRLRALGDGAGLVSGQLDHRAFQVEGGSVHDAIGVVLGLRPVFKVAETIVGSIAVEVAPFHAGGTRADEGGQDKGVHGGLLGAGVPAVAQAHHPVAALSYGSREDFTGSAVGHAIAAGLLMREASDAAKAGYLIPGEDWNFAPDLGRLVSIEHVGYASRTFCLTIQDNHNFLAGEHQAIIVSNCKTLLAAISWPVWTWALPPVEGSILQGPGVRFLCASYGSNKAQGDGVTARRLIGSTWFQELWGDRVVIEKSRDNQEQYDTTAGGSRISTGVPESLGKGGVIRLIDDPSKVDEPESEIMRQSTIRAYDEVWSSRSNDPTAGAEVIIMQRLADTDLSGHVLDRGGFVHLCLPAEYDPRRHCTTRIGWTDPRTEEGEPLWPERFPESWLATQATALGPFAWAGQYQQSPVPRGGGIIKSDWWACWPPDGEEDSWTRHVEVDGEPVRRTLFPDFDYVLVSVDTAFETKQSNDWSACTVWGVFEDRARRPKLMLIEAWRERLELHELVQRIRDTATRRKADAVLVEGKASGLSVIQETRRLMRGDEFQLISIEPKGDKVARTHAVVPMFTGGLIYAPKRKWSDMVIDEVSSFPRGRWDDLHDSCTQALSYMRKVGLAQLVNEVERDELDAMTFHGRKESVAEALGVG